MRIFFALMLAMLFADSVFGQGGQLIRTALTTNQMMNAPTDLMIPYWNNAAKKWSNAAAGLVTATNAQPPTTTLTNLSATGAITNLNDNQFAAESTIASVKDGALLTNILVYLSETIYGSLRVGTNLHVTNSITSMRTMTNHGGILRLDSDDPAQSNSRLLIVNTNLNGSPIVLIQDYGGGTANPSIVTLIGNGTESIPSAVNASQPISLLDFEAYASSLGKTAFSIGATAINNWTDSDSRALVVFNIGNNSATVEGVPILSMTAFNVTNMANLIVNSNLYVPANIYSGNITNDGFIHTSAETVGGTLLVNGFGSTFAQDLTVNGPFIANDSLRLPRGGNPTVNDFGEIAADNDAWAASHGAPRFYDGTSDVFLIGALISDTPLAGQVPKFNSDGTITWEDDGGGGGGGPGTFPMNTTQFNTNNPASIVSGALLTNLSARGLLIPSITADRALMINGSGDVTNANTVTQAELEFLGNVTSDIQSQLNGKMNGQTNASQFGANTVLTLRDGVTVTNANLSGTTMLTNPPGATAALRIWQTNGLGYTEFTVPSQWLPTNRFVLWQTNASAGKLLKVNSVSISGGVATINLTNDFANGSEVLFDDPDGKFAATSVSAALAELNDANGSGPNASDGKVNWTQLVNVPAGFADGTDDGGSGSTNVPVMAVGTLILTNSVNKSWVHLGNDTNIVLNWARTNYYIAAPSNTFTVTWINPPAAGSPAQSMFLELRNTNSAAQPLGYFPTNSFNNGPVIMLSAPSTNTYTFNFDGTNYWTDSGQILTTGLQDTNVFNVQPVIHSPTLIGTNTITGNFAYPTARLFGAGTGGTNYTLFADQADRYMNAESNISIKAVYNAVPGLAMKWSITITNISGANTGIDFSAITNRWRFFNHAYGTNAPVVITNNTALFIDARSDGTNTQVRYNYFAAPL